MKYLSLLLLLTQWLPANAQRIRLLGSEYMDTTAVRNPPCPTYGVRYYSVKGKYPRSSYTLAAEAQAFLAQANQTYEGSGYVTFHFVVDCTGHRQPQVQVLQTDAQYKVCHFRPALIEALYVYFQTLTEWQVGITRQQAVNYLAYLTFKLQNGKVVAVVP